MPHIPELEAEYEFVRVLGEGGTAVVYLARERELGRKIAIKVMRPGFARDTEAVARLEREARLVAGLKHPNIVPLLGTRRLSDGSLALLMQYVPGPTLKRAVGAKGPMPAPVARRILRDVARALEYAHRRHGIVHRDIKPENIYLAQDFGSAVLSDFGIARAAGGETDITLAGTTLGTPAYMSPEQVDGGELDGRSDLYSLGLVAYEMLTGKPPWAGHTLYSIIYKQKHEELPPLRELRPDLPEDLVRAVEGLLAKAPSDRWPDAAAFVGQLQVPSARGALAGEAELAAGWAAGKAGQPLESAPTIRFRPAPGPARQAEPPGTGRSGPARPGPEPAEAERPRREHPEPGLVEAKRPGTGRSDPARSGPEPAEAERPAREHLEPERWVAESEPPDRERRRLWAGLAVVGLILIGAVALSLLADRDGASGGESGVAAADRGVSRPAGPEPGRFGSSAPGAAATAAGAESAASAAAAVARITPAAGHDQVGRAGERLSEPLLLHVVDRDGRPVSGVEVEFEVEAGGGTVSPAGPVRVERGVAAAVLTLGPTAGENRVVARLVGGRLAATFTATGEAPAPAELVLVGSAAREGAPGATLTEAVAVRAEDASGNPVAGAPVEFRVSADGGNVAPRQALTGPDGIARTRWTLGARAGEHTLRAELTSSGLAVELTAQTRSRLSPRQALAAGGTHTCALAADGGVRCWGGNGSGQLAVEGGRAQLRPAAVSVPAAVATVAAGVSHTCAVTVEGAAYCWGENGSGQLGDGSRTGQPAPARTTGGLDFTAVTAGMAHTCALAAGGVAYCWGGNENGRLGDGGTTDRLVPTRVAGGGGFASITAGWTHTCAVGGDGAAYCWGGNSAGQLGDGSAVARTAPRRVEGGHRFTAVAAGATHTCGVTAEGAVLCWGQNRFGQLGDGTGEDHPRPVRVRSEERFVGATAGAHHACGLTAEGAAYCWGRNHFGQLGDGTGTDAPVPVAVAGELRFASLHARGSHTCGRTTSGAEYCWGYNVDGQLGDGSRTNRPRPVRVAAP